MYVSRKTSFLFINSTCTQAKSRCTTLSFFIVSKQIKLVLILLVHVLTLYVAFPGYVTVSTKYKTADLNDSYSGSLVITVAVERGRRPAVLFRVPTPHKPTTDWANDHGLQKQRYILQVSTVVAKDSWCIKTTLKKKSLVHIFGMIACGKAHWSSTLHSVWLCTDSHAKGIWDSLWAKSRQSLDETTILEIKPPSTCIWIFLNPQLFLCGSSFRPHVSGESGIRIRNFLNPLSREENFEYVINPESCGRSVWIVTRRHLLTRGGRGGERPDGLRDGDVWHFRPVGAKSGYFLIQ